MTGMMATGILFYAFTTTVFAILGQRRRGVYSLLRVTPMPLRQYICGVSGAWTLVSLLCALLVLAAGTLVFHLDVSALSILMLLPVGLLAALGYVLLSFFAAMPFICWIGLRYCCKGLHGLIRSNDLLTGRTA